MAKPRPTAPDRPALSAPSLGAWIRQTRASQGVSQRALADRAGLSRSYLCDIEHGRGAQPSVATLDKLAAALGASRADLLRAAGVLDPVASPHEQVGERRLLALLRDLSPEGRAAVERFARFTHHEEHRWVQPPLMDVVGPDADGASAPGPVRQAGPGLFDGLEPGPDAGPRARRRG